MAAVDVQQITKRFGDFTAVDAISFSVEHGEIFGLLGTERRGQVDADPHADDADPAQLGHRAGRRLRRRSARPNDVRKAIGVIPQAMTSDLELSVEENLLIFAKLYEVPRGQRKAAHGGAARGRRADAVGGQAAQEPLGRHAPARRDRARPDPRPAHPVPRRADDGPRSRLARRGPGDAAASCRAEPRPDDPADDPLHGRGRPALRPRSRSWTTASSRRSTRRSS